MGKRYLDVEIGEDGYVVDQPDHKRRPKASPDNQRLPCMKGARGSDQAEPCRPALPPGVRFVTPTAPMPPALYKIW